MTPATDKRAAEIEDRLAFYKRELENERRAGIRKMEKYLAETSDLRKQIKALKIDLRAARVENGELKKKLAAVYKFVPKSVLRSAWARFGPN